MFVRIHLANYNSLSTGASQDHEEEYQGFHKKHIISFKLPSHHGKLSPSASLLFLNTYLIQESLDSALPQATQDIEQNNTDLDDLYLALLQMRWEIDETIATLEEPLRHLSDAETIGDIRKYLKEFSIAFCTLYSLFKKLAGFTSMGMNVATEKSDGLRWHITAFWEDYGHILQIVYTCSLCHQLQDAKLRHGVENLKEKLLDLQVVCEERKEQLEEDLFHGAD
ncbi:hypothetical protein PAAG_08752 [Paracoccidioides lutzii Pb01]|uniref:Uncharacterized protein n=1 Tax=Paracoccidioides lutzii (strain ATCC MYA-826 / Pb01) TaxID=502779 RepID=C1HDB1_PARBA|nr:hypothetical protein PAAG_08752 [Paracoccidioides lutzii Pb01]EEH39483.2 hypothetical protein PAAG_08752 [Paracoccidioides lutzii Pb01]